MYIRRLTVQDSYYTRQYKSTTTKHGWVLLVAHMLKSPGLPSWQPATHQHATYNPTTHHHTTLHPATQTTEHACGCPDTTINSTATHNTHNGQVVMHIDNEPTMKVRWCRLAACCCCGCYCCCSKLIEPRQVTRAAAAATCQCPLVGGTQLLLLLLLRTHPATQGYHYYCCCCCQPP